MADLVPGQRVELDQPVVELRIDGPRLDQYSRSLGALIVATDRNKQVPSDFAPMDVETRELRPGAGYTFENAIVGGVVPKEYIPAVDKGIQEAVANGLMAGYPIVDVKVKLVDGSYHEVDSSEMAFKIAASMAIKEVMSKGAAAVLEPVMAVEVVTPENYMGDAIGSLNSRRGQIQGMQPRGNAQVINAHVPLSEMFGYATDLRSLTQGRATFSMVLDHYAQVPRNIQEELVKK